MANEHGVAGGANNHAQHGEPHVGHAHGRLLPVPDAQHVTHGLEQRVGILLPPGVVLERQTDRQTDKALAVGQDILQAEHISEKEYLT